jgi:hypothetical protein
MAVRRPLVLVGNQKKELPPGDTLPGDALANDFLSAYYYIGAAETITIPEFKQMANFGGLDLDGDLIIEGQLIMEA